MALQGAGFTVDVLYTRVESGAPFCYRGSFEEQVAAFRALGVNLLCIDHQGKWNDWLGKSLRVMEVLQSIPYDVALFDDTHGNAYYSALAKRSGNPALAHTRIVVVAHSATQWICDLNQSPIRTLSDVRLLEIERRSIELADFVVSPSAYILRKYESYGWTLPANTLVRPNILPFSTERSVPPSRRLPIDEIVFFGRIERRKGVWLFCEAIDRLKYELAGKKVTFLGKFTPEDGESTGFTLLRRSAEWPFAPTLLYNYDRDQALAYLKGGNRLAVMPSREDNSPCVILECLIEGIPFIASSGSGGQELIREADHPDCLFEPTVDALTAKLSNVLAKGAMTGQPSFEPQVNARQTASWISGLVSEARTSAVATRKAAEALTASPPIRTTLILFAPEEMAPETAHHSARETALRHPDCHVTVFAEALHETDKTAQGGSSALPQNLRFCPLSAFSEETAKLRNDEGMLVVCRLDQPIDETVLYRANVALRSTDVDAFTMMRGHAIKNVRPERAFVCAGDFHWQPESYTTGNTQALLALSQDSSSGLVIMRAALAGLLARVSPRDQQLCRSKDVHLFVHEVLLALTAEGHSFELIPDCFLTPAAMTQSRETFELPRLTMGHLKSTLNMASGSEATLLSRLSVEIFAGEAARQNAKGLLSTLTTRMGEAILAPKNYWQSEDAFSSFAKIAHVYGRPELALSLMASALKAENPYHAADATPATLTMQRARTVQLTDLAAAGHHTGMNLGHSWSLRIDKQRRMIEIHPNAPHEGDATMVFGSLSLPKPMLFVAEIELPETAKAPVRFEVELQSASANPIHYDWTLQPGERKSVEFALTADFPTECDVLLTTRMLKRRDTTEGAHARWYGAAFWPC